MHNISDFVPYVEGEVKTGETYVLVWSKATGYHFIQFGFIFGDEYQIIARKK